jgi:AcrR family transcriptional regulator
MTVGRRPGQNETRAKILDAAREVFREQGFSEGSLRSIAREAVVDPALVHHFFAGKSELLIEAIGLSPWRQKDPTGFHEDESTGREIVERFLARWETGGQGSSWPFVALVEAMTGSSAAALAMREVLAESIGVHDLVGEGAQALNRRNALIASQLLGIGLSRYVMRMEPLASASRSDVADWSGSSIDGIR